MFRGSWLGLAVACLVAGGVIPAAADAQSLPCDDCVPPPFGDIAGGQFCADAASWLLSDRPLLECLRKQPLHDGWTYSVGGELRFRYMDEHNRLRPDGTIHDTYDLWRFAPFLELGNDWITGRVQAIDASIFDNNIPPTVVDENRSDLLMYYFDVKLRDGDDGTLRLRVGRQFLKYGSEYFVSPLPWVNSYRNFEGFRLYWQSTQWDIDAFAVRPVNGATVPGQYRPTSRDIPDYSVWFSGVYASRKNIGGGALDAYWYWNKEDEALLLRQDGNRHTLGTRYWGAQPLPDVLPTATTWLWDLEGGWQFGTDNFVTPGPRRDVSAGFAGAIGGFRFTDVPWTPQLRGVFWWGDGDSSPESGTISTLTTLYPFGHPHWGILDNFNGANLLEYSLQATVKPHPKATVFTSWHWFDKARREDFIYNASGTALGGPTSSRHLGQELSVIVTWAASKNLELQPGYSWFWYGDAVNEQPVLARGDAHVYYCMVTWGF